jgi:hypothetical protein
LDLSDSFSFRCLYLNIIYRHVVCSWHRLNMIRCLCCTCDTDWILLDVCCTCDTDWILLDVCVVHVTQIEYY